MPEHLGQGERRGSVTEFVADDHDVAASITYDWWRTPSGARLEHGRRYLMQLVNGKETVISEAQADATSRGQSA